MLQQVKEELERAFDEPNSYNLDRSLQLLQDAKNQYGDKGTMINDMIRSLTQAKHAQGQLNDVDDENISPSAAFGQAYNAIEQAIESYNDPNNDPF
nr:hypothetical protein [Salirhabdus salicampi]